MRTLILLKGRRRDLAELTSPTAHRLWRDRGAAKVILVDGILATGEVETLFMAADLLAIPQTEAVLMLADMVKEEPELQIQF